VPADARTVLDLCTGNGVSLPGLRRPGRLLIGIDVSPGMLDRARERLGQTGWAPRLVAADAFHLPLRAGSLDAITIAFGIRNLRPRIEALTEMARLIRPGGTLAVLEAAAPRPGWFEPLHRFHLRHVVPLAGRLSPDPSAYTYLSRSIFEFGSGAEFERDLEAAGFELAERHAFLLGATWLWACRRRGAPAPALQNARTEPPGESEMPQSSSSREREWRWWVGAQLVTALALLAALGYGLWVYQQMGQDLQLPPWQRRGLVALLVGGVVAFAVRCAILAARLMSPPER
jgi:demethylmenaquinone methyltransferase/2-methoxy-6-polyprenyl-1,4-benzoquinol methylase